MQLSAVQDIFSAVQYSAVTAEFLPSIYAVTILWQIVKLQKIYCHSFNDLRLIHWLKSNDQPQCGSNEPVNLMNKNSE